MRSPDDFARLQRLAESLESLRSDLREDLEHAKDLAGALRRLRAATDQVHAQAETTRRLVERIELLKELALTRVRTLDRLRGRMRQLRGGSRPH